MGSIVGYIRPAFFDSVLVWGFIRPLVTINGIDWPSVGVLGVRQWDSRMRSWFFQGLLW